jgi:hypothetical protein
VHRLNHRIEPLGKDRPEGHARLLGRGDHPIDPLERDLERLLADHGHSLADSREDGIEMRPRRRGDRDEVGLLLPQHRRGVTMPGAAKLGREGPPLLLGAATGGHERDARDIAQRPRMKPGNRPDANDRRPHRMLPLSASRQAFGPRSLHSLTAGKTSHKRPGV